MIYIYIYIYRERERENVSVTDEIRVIIKGVGSIQLKQLKHLFPHFLKINIVEFNYEKLVSCCKSSKKYK